MRVVFAGTPEVAVPALDAVHASRHELVGVVTRPDAPAGRGRRLVASPVAQRAEELGVPVLKPTHPRDPEFQDRLRALAPDCCPVVAYGALLPESVLDIPVHGWVNLHFSALPAWRGAAPVQHALWAGDEVTGATTFRIVKELDAGPTYGVMTELVRPRDTAGDLLGRLAEGGAGLLVMTLDGIEDGELRARAQPAEGVSYAPKIEAEDARVDWKQPAVAIDRQVRACTPAPGAWTTYAGERLKLGPVEPCVQPPERPLTPGELVVTKREVLVGTGTAPVRLGAVKPFGKREMPAADWARGTRLGSGTVLGAAEPDGQDGERVAPDRADG
jgi:methionyl-tRNA formyltransferase